MKQFTQLLVLVFLSVHFHLSASGIHKHDTIGMFNEITDIEVQLRNIHNITQNSKGNDNVPTTDTTLDRVDSASELPQNTGVYLTDTINTALDTLVVSSKDTIITPIDTNPVTLPDAVGKDSAVIPIVRGSVFTPPIIKTSLDANYSRNKEGIIELPPQIEDSYDPFLPRLNFRDTMFYNPLFLPIVFSGRIESPDSVFVSPENKDNFEGVLIPSDNTFKTLIEKRSFIDKVRRNYYLNNPTSIKFSASSLSSARQTASDVEVREKFNPFKELLTSETSFSLEKPEIEGVKIGRVYWVKSGEHSFQLSQNYFSPNWHKGGTSNLNINSYNKFNVNYSKNKVKFNNMFEWRLSVYNAPDDSMRNYRIGDDLLRYYGDFGIDAFKKTWSYSTNLEVKTQMFTSHIPNKDELRSAFLAPLYVNAGIGMKYILDKKSETVRNRRVRLSVDISPLSINYKYVGNDEVESKRFGIPEGKTSIFDKGSTITSALTYDFTKYISWNVRMKYFTNYSKVETEMENTLNMALSRFFSTRIYLHLRYDDGVPKDDDYGYLQVSEVVSFGLNFKW